MCIEDRNYTFVPSHHLGSCGPLQEYDALNMPHLDPWSRYGTRPIESNGGPLE